MGLNGFQGIRLARRAWAARLAKGVKMKIVNNKLQGVPFLPSPNTSGSLRAPTLLVLHYTASGDNKGGDAKYFQRSSSKASAHIVIERDGSVIQCVPFNTVAWHAGKSSWQGKNFCNSFSIGIEIDNWGLLEKRANGAYYSHAGTQVPAHSVFVGPNKLGNGKYWEVFPPVQLDAVENVVAAILEKYPSITEIVGHEDISPRRKIDPGPALYSFMQKLEDKFLDNRKEDEPKKMTVTAAPHLNVRSGPSGTKIGEVLQGKIVDVLYSQGNWSRISWPAGWVHNSYLK